MKTQPSLNNRFLVPALFLLLPLSGVRADWFFEAGPFYRGQMKISVDGGSRAADTGANAATPGIRGGLPSSGVPVLNDAGGSGFRSFDNGYVGPSGWVWAQNAGITQFFGYQTADQYDAGADTLSFTGTTSGTVGSSTRTSTRVSNVGPSGWNDSKRTNGMGLIGTLGYRLGETDPEEDGEEKTHEWSLLFRFGWLEGMGATFRNRSALRQEVVRRSETNTASSSASYRYTYDTLGNPFFPTAPYAMTDPGGVGPLIADTPQSIDLISRTDSLFPAGARTALSGATSFVDLDLDVRAFTLQAGPRWLYCPEAAVSLYLQPAVTLNLIDATAHRTETFRDDNGRRVASWHDRADDQAWRWGGGIQFGARVTLSDHWYLNGSGGYEWVRSANLDVGPDRVRIDISGYQLELALGRSF